MRIHALMGFLNNTAVPHWENSGSIRSNFLNDRECVSPHKQKATRALTILSEIVQPKHSPIAKRSDDCNKIRSSNLSPKHWAYQDSASKVTR